MTYSSHKYNPSHNSRRARNGWLVALFRLLWWRIILLVRLLWRCIILLHRFVYLQEIVEIVECPLGKDGHENKHQVAHLGNEHGNLK